MYWNPNPQAFEVPFFHIPIYWYSLFFGFGFLTAYFLVFADVKTKTTSQQAARFTDRLAIFLFAGVLLGARLGHVFFYDWDYFSAHPEQIFSIPMRGLASHGALAGVFGALFIFWKMTPPLLTFKALLDSIARAAVMCGAFIRTGNFMNQEIIGTPTTLPWAITFGNPMETAFGPCHPAQLYEALFYIFVFALLYAIKDRLQEGITAGLCLVLVFTFRFFIEYIKLSQGGSTLFGLKMGQLLSIPMVCIGLYFLASSRKKY